MSAPLIIQLIINETNYDRRAWFSHPRVGEIVEIYNDADEKSRCVVTEIVHRVPSKYALRASRQEIDVYLEDEK